MKLEWKREAPLLALVALMFGASGLAWPHAPGRLPVHWNLHGEPDRWGGKVEGLLLLPLLAIGLWALFAFLPRIDPGRANYPTFAGPYRLFRFAVLAVLAGLHAAMLLPLAGRPVRMERAAPLLIGAMMVVVGGVLGKIRPNWFVGIRTPWTLSSKLAWTRTHRVGGWLFVATGLATMAAALVGPRLAFATLLGGALASTAVSLIYSWAMWRRDPDRVPPAGASPAEDPAPAGPPQPRAP